MGGGTFDISILNIQQGIFEVLSTNGDTHLGGDDFDHAIVNHWTNQYSIPKLTNNDRQLLRITAEQAKKELSSNSKFKKTIQVNNQDLTVTLSQKELENIIQPIINRTISICNNALSDA